MSRGVVLWPDERVAGVVRELWSALERSGLPSLATHTHRLHQPHCSLSVAEELPLARALDAVGVVPSQRVPLLVGSVGVFPPNGALFLACVANKPLLSEQHRVHRALASLAVRPWPYFEFHAWVPHITLSMGMTSEELAKAIPLVMDRLPITGTFDHGGVEDGTTGEHWPAPSPD
jgi:2'-5' RNA ligase